MVNELVVQMLLKLKNKHPLPQKMRIILASINLYVSTYIAIKRRRPRRLQSARSYPPHSSPPIHRSRGLEEEPLGGQHLVRILVDVAQLQGTRRFYLCRSARNKSEAAVGEV